MSRIDCILYPPTLDYDYLVQRPQQLMKHFSLLDVPSFFLNLPSPHSNTPHGIVKPNPNLYLFNHVDPRPYLQNIRPVVYFSAAWHIDIVQQYNPSLIVFDSVDEPSDEFEAWKPYYMRAVSLSDVVLNTSDRLFETACGINPHSYLVPNGCDYEYFCQATSGSLPIPADLAGITGPIIGYIGVVATWVDLELIDRLAAEFPNCNVVVVGPLYNVSNVPQRSNIHWLGFKPYEELASYAQRFNVGLIPFIQSNMTESVNPIKMWEYMAAGVPVVTTAIPEASKYEDLVLYSTNHDEFVYNVHRALNYDSMDLRHQRMVLAEQNSWRHRAQTILDIIDQRLYEKGLGNQGVPSAYIDSLIEGIAPQTLDFNQTGAIGFVDGADADGVECFADLDGVFPDHSGAHEPHRPYNYNPHVAGGHGHRQLGHEAIDALIDSIPPQSSIVQFFSTHRSLKISTRRPVHIGNITRVARVGRGKRVHTTLVSTIKRNFRAALVRKIKIKRKKNYKIGNSRIKVRRGYGR